MCGYRWWTVLVVAVAMAAPVRGERVIERYEDGTLKADYTVGPDDQKRGYYRDFHPNGKLKTRCMYRNDKLVGPYTEYSEAGRPMLTAVYREGQLEGECREWDEDRRLKRVVHYVAGVLHGKEQIFADGKLIGERMWDHGEALLNSQSPEQIHLTLRTIAATAIEGPGTEAHKDAVRRLMAYRFLCGVPYQGIALDAQMNAEAAAAAKVCEKLGRLTHAPESNPGLPADVFELGKAGASRSNLTMGTRTLAASIDGYMGDSDPSNIDRVGHRRWCLNPPMAKVGFGVAGDFSAMWTFDRSRREVPDWDVVAYPPRGYIPVEYFASDYPWSVTVNTQRLEAPAEATIKVMAWPGRGRDALDVAATRAGEPLPLNYFHVDDSGRGSGPAIIFRPDRVAVEPGRRYLVEIEGLKERRSDRGYPLRYVVAFIR